MATQVAITGNLAAEPEIFRTNSGQVGCSLLVAENTGWRGADGRWVEGDPVFWPVTVWGEWAENVAASLAKGSRVSVIGRVRSNSWTSEDGQKRTRIVVIADEVAASMRFARVAIQKQPRREPVPAPEPVPA